jgi:hypothetical protein
LNVGEYGVPVGRGSRFAAEEESFRGGWVMTEKEWIESSNPRTMAEFVGNDWDRGKKDWIPPGFKFSDRKFRLLACGCCRLSERIFNPAQFQALEAADLFVEGQLGPDDFKVVTKEFGGHCVEFWDALHDDQLPDRKAVAGHLISCACLHPRDQPYPSDCAIEATFGASFLPPSEVRMFRSSEPEPSAFGGLYYPTVFEIRSVPVSELIRDIFGNPFRPVAFDPRWRTADAVGLARGINEDRAFDRLPLLADALMDAGCADEQVLGHCRSDGPHVRGCWVVDLVLGKE